MGNKHSSLVSYPFHEHTRVQTNRDHSIPVSHTSLKYPSATESMLSDLHKTIWSKNSAWLSHLNNSHVPRKSTTCPPSVSRQDAMARAYEAFLNSFPEYETTCTLDTLRKVDFGRLDRTGETYVDYMGGAPHPESLVHFHSSFLNGSVMGNTHSISNSSKLSSQCADEARNTVLSFFHAPPGYTVIFTANATGALKLVGEAYPFTTNSSYVLCVDSHNSVHGIRNYASSRGAKTHYIPSTSTGGFVLSTAQDVLLQHKTPDVPSLFALTGLSNISNTKNPLSILEFASSIGYHTLLDAAALAPSSHISLSETPVDAMAVSFYKMFGYPTGVGALIVKESFLETLERPWFAGGTVNVVQVPGSIFTRASNLHEQFEDGTINFMAFPAITGGLRLLSLYLPLLPLRLSCLTHYLITSLSLLRHNSSGTPVVKILSRLPSTRLKSVGEQADSGSTVTLIFLSPSGAMLPNSFIESAAVSQNISLRTGCMCNPGGAAALLGIQDQMEQLYHGVTLKDFECIVGHEIGVVRISMGLASNFQDVWRVVEFASSLASSDAPSTLGRMNE